MRVLIFGAGVIGTIYGQALSESGTEIIHYVRPNRIEKLKNGIKLQLIDSRKKTHSLNKIYRLDLTTELPSFDDFDLVIISVRHYQLDSILPLISEKLGKADILFFNHLWSDTSLIDQYIPREKYLLGFPSAGGGFYETPDLTLKGSLMDRIYIGELNGQVTTRLENIVKMFKEASIKVEIQKNIIHWLWKHFSLNAGISTMIMKTGSVENFISNLSNIHQGVYCIREALEVCKARGVNLMQFSDARAFFLPSWIAALGFWFMMKINRSQREIFENYKGIDEIQVIYKNIVQTGTNLHVPMPILSSMDSYVNPIY